MLLRCIQSENLKLKHSVIYSACLLLPVIPAIMGTFNYQQNLGILTEGWYSLWTQITLFYSSFFYSPLIGLYCSYLWRLEHRNHNWNVLMTAPVKISSMYLGKLTVIFKITLLTQCWIGILFFFCGKITGIEEFFPLEILFWLLRGTLAAAAIGSLQLLMSMVIRNFAIPIGIALLGSVFGLLSTNAGFGLAWPYSLMLIGMNSNKGTDVMQGLSDLLPFLGAAGGFFLFFYGLAILRLYRSDVRA